MRSYTGLSVQTVVVKNALYGNIEGRVNEKGLSLKKNIKMRKTQ